MTVTHDVDLAMSADFLRAFAKLPKKIQKKTRTWIDKFRKNPDAATSDYESLHGMRDDKVRTSRIDQKYRAVLVHPKNGNVCLLVWVDNHDEAHAWARNKVFEVNRYTGTFQVYEARAGQEAQAEAEAPADVIALPPLSEPIPPGFLLHGTTGEDLLLLGVPEPLLPAVTTLRTANDLDALNQYLPQEASDAAYMLASGYTVDQVMEEFDRRQSKDAQPEPTFDPEDLSAALERPSTQREFKRIDDDDALAEMLAAPLEQWRVFLHPSQAKIIRMKSKGSARVLGGAGTGKTVVAMHRIRHLAQEVFSEPEHRLLFTTFTANLAADIEGHLRKLCGPEFERIEVKHLQQVARDVLSAKGRRMPARAMATQENKAWSEAFAVSELEFPEVFYREEWTRVLQAQDVIDLDGYLRARRAGRGKRISRQQRREAWKVFEAYRRALTQAGYCEFADVIREAREALEQGERPYHAVVADEVQDFCASDLRLLRALVDEGPNDIFVVGDPHQRIYGRRASLSRCGISVRGGQGRKLRVNYRTTQKIRNWAVARLEGLEFDNLDEATDDLGGEHSLRLGAPPTVRVVPSESEEAALIVDNVQGWIEAEVKHAEICICARTTAAAKRYADLLNNHGIETVLISKREPAGKPTCVRVATMHRVKGLEFSRVVLAGVTADTLPFRDMSFGQRDDLARELYVRSERQLLYVAATRARDELVITGYGDRSSLLQ